MPTRTGLPILWLALAVQIGAPGAASGVEDDGAVTIVQIGDPQIGERCDKPSFNPSGEIGACEEEQQENLIEAFELADDLDADLVWIMGDHTKSRTSNQRRLFRQALERYPQLNIRLVAGNHDVGFGGCDALANYLRNAFDESPSVPRPNFEVTEIDGHYFIGLNTNLWGGDMWQFCEELPNVCAGGSDPAARAARTPTARTESAPTGRPRRRRRSSFSPTLSTRRWRTPTSCGSGWPATTRPGTRA